MKPVSLAFATIVSLGASSGLADQIVTLPDGAQVILRDNHTWEFAVRTPPPNTQALEQYCYRYAGRASEQAEVNLQAQCGNAGEAWHQDWNAHRAWCLSQPPDLPSQEILTREAALLSCTDQRLDCRRYASMAREHEQQNQINGCGFVGEAWHVDLNGHYAWCLQQTETRLLEETAERERALARCVADRTTQ
ncbi:DUF3157 family protein [Nioella nitratireducens]|uniref:DUF3157 family protein n=1 Tax=Nioella nitratireducens TaxID=1287720 RepID=UPI001314900A|nr:DUF3157 family protein [Nioella nitratireducens]